MQERSVAFCELPIMSLMRVALLVLVALILAPLVSLFATVPPFAVLEALRSTFASGALQTSLVASLVATTTATLLGVPAGYALARGDGRIRAAALVALSLPLALPPVAVGVALLGLVATRSWLGAWLAAHGASAVDSTFGVALAMFAVSGSVVAIVATTAFLDVDRDLEEAARTLGAGRLRVAATIAVPLAFPSVCAGMALGWVRAIGEYGATSIVAYHPTSLPIQLVVALSADGVPAALALAEAFVVLALVGVACAALVRRRLA